MRRKKWLAVISAVLLIGVAFVVWTKQSEHADVDWVTADEFVLYSVDGRDEYEQKDKPAVPTGEILHGYPVLGKVEVTNTAERRRLTAAFTAALQPGYGSKCFWPRHVVRLRHGKRTTEYVICFQCQTLMEWADGQ